MAKYPQAIGPYSVYIEEGGKIYASGQLPLDPDTGEIVAGFEAQCRQAFANISGILDENGLTLDAIFKLTIYLSDLSHFNTVNVIMEELFHPPYLVRTAFAVAGLPKDALIEVEAIAKKD